MAIVDRLRSLASDLRHPGDRRHLAEDHATFDGLFEDVRNRAEAGDWQECDAIWKRFGAALEQHFRFEEQQLWPEFAASSASARAEVSALQAEHAEIRKTLDRLAVEIELKRVDREAIERLIEQLRAHARHENELFYPWARSGAA
ncbi:hemerythrin domain-containing protein [Nannocystaceae bacterium ST9]